MAVRAGSANSVKDGKIPASSPQAAGGRWMQPSLATQIRMEIMATIVCREPVGIHSLARIIQLQMCESRDGYMRRMAGSSNLPPSLSIYLIGSIAGFN